MASYNPFDPNGGFMPQRIGMNGMPQNMGGSQGSPVPQGIPTFPGPMPQAPQPQAQRIAQAFQPPVSPAFTRPENQFSPMLDAIKQPLASSGAPKGPSRPQEKPSGPIMVQNAPPSTPQLSAPQQATNVAEDPNANNPWINPAKLAGMALGASSNPGDGLWSFLGSGAPQGMKDASNGGYGPPIPADLKKPSGGLLGETGSPMSVLTGGDLDPKSPLAALAKLFGGGLFS